ncbi:MAG: hypothetical protein CMH46_03850 [Muricauda sp.]|nr:MULTISPECIES: hypothetical protein [unclassified Allomuricauda]MAU14656.1 hypothetical protein [Allomuricauda sp.]|tara:strand:+ start:2856 stop:3278 length:423 start_codon:yes stop_codon:yes gene_type:complete
MSEEKQFNFQIKGIEILDTSIVRPKSRIDGNTVFGFELQAQHSFNLERELVIVTCNVEVLDNNSKDKLGHVNASCLYYVENFEQYFDKEKNTSNLPQDVITMLNSISISTIRGVMYGIFRGTFLNGAILPIVNPNMQIKK